MEGKPNSGTPIMPPTKNIIKPQNTKKIEKQTNYKNHETNIKKHNRRSLKRNKRAFTKVKEFTVYGNNYDIIGSKVHLFIKVLTDLVPSIFVLQETKRKVSDPQLKAPNLSNYQIFELHREKEKQDGGRV